MIQTLDGKTLAHVSKDEKAVSTMDRFGRVASLERGPYDQLSVRIRMRDLKPLTVIPIPPGPLEQECSARFEASIYVQTLKVKRAGHMLPGSRCYQLLFPEPT
jgi:hypothetical protein